MVALIETIDVDYNSWKGCRSFYAIKILYFWSSHTKHVSDITEVCHLKCKSHHAFIYTSQGIIFNFFENNFFDLLLLVY